MNIAKTALVPFVVIMFMASVADVHASPTMDQNKMRLYRCKPADHEKCLAAIHNIIDTSPSTIASVPFSPNTENFLKPLNVKIVQRFKNTFVLVGDKSAALGGWRPPGGMEGYLIVTSIPDQVEALRRKLITGLGVPAKNLWFPETGGAQAWRGLSLARRNLIYSRPVISQRVAGNLATLAKSGTNVKVETSQGTRKDIIDYLVKSLITLKVSSLPPSRFRVFSTVADGRNIIGLPGEVMVRVEYKKGSRTKESSFSKKVFLKNRLSEWSRSIADKIMSTIRSLKNKEGQE